MNFAILYVLVFSYVAQPGQGEVLDCSRPNEYYACGSACQTTCRNLGQKCAFVNVNCNDACYCKTSYARDDSGKCIPMIDCEK